MKHWVDFRSTPPIGTILRLDEQVYELEHVEPYARATGQSSSLLIWRTGCPRCGQSFTVTTGLRARAVNRRCEACRLRARAPVSGRSRRAEVVVSVEFPSDAKEIS